MGIIPRFSSAWKELYQKRSSIERYFSSAKQSRLLNRHQCLGQAKVELHVNMVTLAYALTALAPPGGRRLREHGGDGRRVAGS